MPIIINWVEQDKQIEGCIEIPLFNNSIKIYYFDTVIARTEWQLGQSDRLAIVNSQWKEVEDYLNSPINTLTVRLANQGSTFRHRVWAEMCKIPVGQTVSYSALARKIDSGARAVANVCRDNPFPGLIPCHRVVSLSGLGGFMGQTSGSALELKREILDLEAVLVNKKNLEGITLL